MSGSCMRQQIRKNQCMMPRELKQCAETAARLSVRLDCSDFGLLSLLMLVVLITLKILTSCSSAQVGLVKHREAWLVLGWVIVNCMPPVTTQPCRCPFEVVS